MRRVAVFVAFIAPSPAFAHGGHVHWNEAASGWTLDPVVTLPLLLAAGLFAAGVAGLWGRAGRGRGVRSWQVAAFAAGWLALAGALASPLHRWGETLFTAHMVEHEILMAVAAPLLVLSRPGPIVLWAFPASWRSGLGRAGRVGVLRAVWAGLTDPLSATVLHGVALWVWHAPALFGAALESGTLHWLQHLSFLASALVFWWALLHGRAGARGYGAAVFYLFATALHSGFLGILLTLAPEPIYPGQDGGPAWGLTALEDQQLGGLIMWVPAGLVYAGAALALIAIWIQRSAAEAGGPVPSVLRIP